LTGEQHRFDIVLLDLSLPDKNGELLILEIVELSKKTPVIVLTGYADVKFGVKTLSLGVADYILKDDLSPAAIYKSVIYSLERKKIIIALEDSEIKYSELFHLSPSPMFVFDLVTLNFLDVNNAAIKHYGYTIEEFLKLTIQDIRPVEDLSQLEDALVIARSQTQLMLPDVYRHKKKNGEIIYVEIQGNTISYKGLVAKVILATDVTERFNYIRAIEEKNKKLEGLLWFHSHKIRSPVATIMALVPLIRDLNDGDPEMKTLLNFLEKSITKLDDTIREVAVKNETV
jgi:PAS domain S-box-containing protein